MNTISRRKFLYASSSVAIAAFVSPSLAKADNNKTTVHSGLQTGKPIIQPYASIPGFLSAEQLAPHYSAHYGGALRGYIKADEKLHSSIMTAASIDSNAYAAIQRARANKANSVILHELYFEGMLPKGDSPKAEIHQAIDKRFGSIDKWAADFQVCAKSASGWAVLAYDSVNGKLYNLVCDKHASGLLWMATPLIVLDAYEHAYYVDYKNNKTDYIDKFMSHINWGEVNSRYSAVRSVDCNYPAKSNIISH